MAVCEQAEAAREANEASFWGADWSESPCPTEYPDEREEWCPTCLSLEAAKPAPD